MDIYLKVAEDEGDESIELPAEEDGTLLLSTLQAQYPGACGLKYRNAETNKIRGVRLNEEHFSAPSDTGWGSETYFCVFPKEIKRKCDDNSTDSTPKTKRVEGRSLCTDLILLGLAWKTTDQSLRDYFEKFGEVLMAQIKKDSKTGQSKGFGFVKFSSYEVQMRVLATRHNIDGRWCEVKIPDSKDGIIPQLPSKIFVGRCTEDMTADDIREHFSKFGEVIDVYIPNPFRGFSFVTFLDPEIGKSLCGEDHIIKGSSVYISDAAPKSTPSRNSHHNKDYGNRPFGSSDTRGTQHRMSRHDSVPYPTQRSGYSSSPRLPYSGYWSQNRGNTDLPNLQTLGINNQGSDPSNQGQNMNNNPLNVGLNLNALPIVAAALNQWGLLGNLQNQNQGFGNSGGGGAGPGSQTSSPQQTGGYIPRGVSQGDNNCDGLQPTQDNNPAWSRRQSGNFRPEPQKYQKNNYDD